MLDMKKLISIISIMSMLFCFNGCYSTVTEMPSDFNFSLNFGYGNAVNCIDTFNDTLTKDLITAGAKVTLFIIPDKKMEEIYTAFRENNISNLPTDFDGLPDNVSMSPSYRYVLTYTANGKTRTITCNNAGGDESEHYSEDHNDLVRFANVVREYVFSTEEYRNMPEAEGGYL